MCCRLLGYPGLWKWKEFCMLFVFFILMFSIILCVVFSCLPCLWKKFLVKNFYEALFSTTRHLALQRRMLTDLYFHYMKWTIMTSNVITIPLHLLSYENPSWRKMPEFNTDHTYSVDIKKYKKSYKFYIYLTICNKHRHAKTITKYKTSWVIKISIVYKSNKVCAMAYFWIAVF